MAYKVVIIDDEPIIVEGLTRSIPWEQWDCQVVASAFSGEEGNEIIRTVKPDILFSDICMPGISGLAMIAGLKSEYPDMQITILTGYRDFEYAREAIHLGVTRFLLKPSKMEELKEAVEIMTEKLRNRGIFPEAREKASGELFQKSWEEINAASAREGVRKGQENKSEKEDDASTDGAEREESTVNSFIVKNAVAYIEEHYQDKLKLSDVAEQVYVSQWHLSKLLNRYMCQSFSDILNHIRIEKAKELLRDPSLRIGDIAEQVGFLDMAHFSRVFKKQAGMSANEYRNTKLQGRQP